MSFFSGVSLLAIVPLQLRSHQCCANTTTTVACGRINTPHRCCGVNTLTATTTAAAITSWQQWQHCHRCLGRSNNHRRTVTAPMTVAQWPTFFFWYVHSACHCRLLASLLAPSWPLRHRSHGPTKAVPTPPLPPQSHQCLGPSLPLQHQCPHHHHTCVRLSAPLQQGSGHGSTITVTMTVAPPSPLLCLWQHPCCHWGCSISIATAASPRPRQHPHCHRGGSTVKATRPIAWPSPLPRLHRSPCSHSSPSPRAPHSPKPSSMRTLLEHAESLPHLFHLHLYTCSPYIYICILTNHCTLKRKHCFKEKSAA